MQNKLAERLSEECKIRKLSYRKLSQIAEVSDHSIGDWTKGDIQPNAESIYLICKALDISADYLLGLSDY